MVKQNKTKKPSESKISSFLQEFVKTESITTEKEKLDRLEQKDQFKLIQEISQYILVHPEARLKAGEIYEGDLGRKAGASMSPHTDRKEVEDDHFARLVADEAKKLDDCDRIHLAAPPKFLGLLRKRLDKSVERKVAGTLAKDLIHMTPHELKLALTK